MRDVILQAAEHIEKHPEDYCFISMAAPSPGRVAGCALGWIAHFAEIHDAVHDPRPVPAVAAELLSVSSPSEFYDCMDSYNIGHRHGETWTTSARQCARALRIYADEFFPE